MTGPVNDPAAPVQDGTPPVHDDTPPPSLVEGPAITRGPGYVLGLIVHLARRETAITHRFSLIGAAWPLLRQLAQLAVLVIAFSKILDLGIENYPVFVFTGLIGWTWFTAGLLGATNSVLDNRALVLRAGFPTYVLPVVGTAVPLIDALYALPVLAVMLAVSGELHASALAFFPLLVLQGAFGVGLGWFTAALAVRFRDVPQIVTVVLLMGFYLTPVYFDISRVPPEYQSLLRLNPMTVLLEADRAALLGTPWPPVGALVGVALVTIGLLAAGWIVFRRMAPRFADEL